MNRKKTGWIFLLITALSIGVSLSLSFLYAKSGYSLPMIANLFVSESIIVVPTVLLMLFSKENWKDILRLKKIKISTALVVVVFTICCAPLISTVNLISQLFVENTVTSNSAAMLSMPPVILLFMVAVNAPVCEEFVFRGAILSGYRKSGNKVKAILLSALLFGLMHMNLNQASYAFVIGIILALLVEVTGSIYSSLIFHAVVNGTNTLLLLMTSNLYSDQMQSAAASITTAMLMNYICIFFVFAVGGMAIAACLLVWIAKNENHPEVLHEIWESRKVKPSKVFSIPLLLAIILCVGFIIFQMIV